AVLLRRDDATERLDFPLEPVPLRGDEALYPDFVDLDARTNTFDDAVQLQAGPGYMLKTPKHAWGTPRTVAAIQGALRRYVDRGLGGPDVHVGDISLQRGGPFPPHLSHQDGRDVDVGYVLQGEFADVSRFVIASRGRLDVVRSWALLDAFLATDRVRYVFVDYALQRILYAYAKEQGVPQDRLDALFQYPRGSAAARGLIRHWRGHANHFHVRFVR
ncbi:MAG: penicillin-insensitive murein endopeptidase, partial [Myxococcota bacterium]